MGKAKLTLLTICSLTAATATFSAARGDCMGSDQYDMYVDHQMRTCSLCHFPRQAAITGELHIPQWSRAHTLSQIKREQLQQQAKTITRLRQELDRTAKALAEARALLNLGKKLSVLWEVPDGGMDLLHRKKRVALVKAACAAGAPLAPACRIAGISEGTLQRYSQSAENSSDR